jgi:hypothetical protein
MVNSPSTRTFLVLMVTLTPSGTSSNSSEWLFQMSAQVHPYLQFVAMRASWSWANIVWAEVQFVGSGDWAIAFADRRTCTSS